MPTSILDTDDTPPLSPRAAHEWIARSASKSDPEIREMVKGLLFKEIDRDPVILQVIAKFGMFCASLDAEKVDYASTKHFGTVQDAVKVLREVGILDTETIPHRNDEQFKAVLIATADTIIRVDTLTDSDRQLVRWVYDNPQHAHLVRKARNSGVYHFAAIEAFVAGASTGTILGSL